MYRGENRFIKKRFATPTLTPKNWFSHKNVLVFFILFYWSCKSIDMPKYLLSGPQTAQTFWKIYFLFKYNYFFFNFYRFSKKIEIFHTSSWVTGYLIVGDSVIASIPVFVLSHVNSFCKTILVRRTIYRTITGCKQLSGP